MKEKMKEIICNYVETEPENITDESRFIEDLGFTSYDFMSMLGELEEVWEVEINEQDTVNIKTVGEAIVYLEKLKCARA